jgi:hypothetical protein
LATKRKTKTTTKKRSSTRSSTKSKARTKARSKPKTKSTTKSTTKTTKKKRKPNKKAFGSYAISFARRKETVEQVFGKRPLKPSEMTKKIWAFVKAKNLATNK